MIDIIIPAYNAHNTIVKTLANLSLQTIREQLKVYIVNDCSDKNYSKETKYFKKYLDITELKTPHNMGPGLSRQYAMERTKGKYIVFLDADDQIYNPYILNLLMSKMENEELDLIYGDEIIEGKTVNRDNTGSLHGKMYRRSFIEKNKIKFNATRYSEDDGFNKLCMNLSEKIKKEKLITHIYMNNASSITNKPDKRVKNLIMYSYNMIWTILELEKRHVKAEKISKLILKAYMYIYQTIITDKYSNYELVYEKSYRIEELFKKYKKYISNSLLEKSIRNNIYIYTSDSKQVLSDFSNFRKKFIIKKSKIDVIIPAYNSHDKIMNALHSILSQSISDKINVYIMNNCSYHDYSKEINEVKEYLNITEIKTPEKLSIGALCQYGIDHSQGEYIVFLWPNDVFNDGLSLKNIYNIMEEDNEDILGSFYNVETSNGFEEAINNVNKVYGKIYRRSYILKNKLKFTNSNTSFDFEFNQTISMKQRIKFTDNYTYISRIDENSEYKKIKNEYGYVSIKDITDSIKMIVKKSEEKKCNKNNIAYMLIESMYDFYYKFITSNVEEEQIDILNNLKDIKPLYLEYIKVLPRDYYQNNLYIMYNKLTTKLGIELYSQIDLSFNNFLILIDNLNL